MKGIPRCGSLFTLFVYICVLAVLVCIMYELCPCVMGMIDVAPMCANVFGE